MTFLRFHAHAQAVVRVARTVGCCLALLMIGLGSVHAAEDVPAFNLSDLPPLGADWRETNPYRGNADIAREGQTAFNQNCARCHGVDAVASGAGAMPAPDLRRLDRYCYRLAPGELREACMADIDHYFLHSVREGKLIVGVRHMPVWEGHLTQETMWAIKTFLETRGAPPQH